MCMKKSPDDSSPKPFTLSSRDATHCGAEKRCPCCALLGLPTFRIHEHKEMVVVWSTALWVVCYTAVVTGTTTKS